MKILRRYILAEMYAPFLIGLFAFTLVVLLHRFSLLADLVVSRGVPPRLVGDLLLSLFPAFLEITLPASLLLAVLLTLGRLSADSETTALYTAGVGMRSVAVPVLIVSLGAFAVNVLIGWEGIAWGQRTFKTTLARIISVRAGAAASEHVFRELTPDVLLFPDRVSTDGTRMTGVLLSQRVGLREPVLVFAREGSFTPEERDRPLTLVLSEGALHYEDDSSGTYRVASFRSLSFRLPRDFSADGGGDDPRSMTLPELRRRVLSTGGTGRDATYRYHFHRRLSLAASCLAFGLLAVPLGLSQRARGRSPAVSLTLAVVLFYYLFLAAAGAVEASAPSAMVLLLWLPNAIGLGLAAWILRRSESRIVALPVLFRSWAVRR